jgi:CDGSH-type Zn-finger protein
MAAPRNVRVTPYRDGPLIVRGAATLLDADGGELKPRRDPIALCRCGKSRLRPFCDGTHKLIGFRAPGVPESADDDWLADLAKMGIEIP